MGSACSRSDGKTPRGKVEPLPSRGDTAVVTADKKERPEESTGKEKATSDIKLNGAAAGTETTAATEATIPPKYSSLLHLAPRLLVSELVEYGNKIQRARCVQLTGAFLAVNISGLETVCVREDVEETTKMLNSVLAPVLIRIKEFSGDVFQLSASTIRAFFKPEQEAEEDPFHIAVDPLQSLANVLFLESLKPPALRAVRCGHALLGITVPDSRIHVKIGVGVGVARTMFTCGVGDSWKTYLCTDHFEQLEAAIEECRGGELIVSDRVWQLVNRSCEGEQAANGFRVTKVPTGPLPILDEPKFDEDGPLQEAIIPFLSKPLQLAVTTDDKRAFTGHYARMTIVHVALAGTTFEMAKTKAMVVYLANVDNLLRKVQETFNRHGGDVLHVYASGNNCCVIVASFGSPGAEEHGAAPVRGVTAALELSKEIPAMDKRVEVYVGVGTGKTIGSVFGSASRQDYVLVGSAFSSSDVLMANNLRTQRPGVLCDATTYHATKRKLEYVRSEPIIPHHLAMPVAAFRVVGLFEEPKHLRPVQMTGLESPLATLLEKLQELFEGKPASNILIEADACMGKSLLKEEFIDKAEALGAAISCDCGDLIDDSDYEAIHEAFFDILDHDGATLQEHILMLLNLSPRPGDAMSITRVTPEAMEYRKHLPLLNTLFPVEFEPLPGHPDPREMPEADERMKKTNALAVDVLTRHAAFKRGTVLVVDDLQWGDDPSWDLLEFLCSIPKEQRKVMAVLITQKLHVEPSWLATADLIRIKLPLLTPESLSAVLSYRLELKEVHPDLRDIVLSKSAGNPFFAESIAEALYALEHKQSQPRSPKASPKNTVHSPLRDLMRKRFSIAVPSTPSGDGSPSPGAGPRYGANFSMAAPHRSNQSVTSGRNQAQRMGRTNASMPDLANMAKPRGLVKAQNNNRRVSTSTPTGAATTDPTTPHPAGASGSAADEFDPAELKKRRTVKLRLDDGKNKRLLDHLLAPDFPPNITGVTKLRLTRLSPVAQAVAKFAGVVGDVFSAEVLMDLVFAVPSAITDQLLEKPNFRRKGTLAVPEPSKSTHGLFKAKDGKSVKNASSKSTPHVDGPSGDDGSNQDGQLTESKLERVREGIEELFLHNLISRLRPDVPHRTEFRFRHYLVMQAALSLWTDTERATVDKVLEQWLSIRCANPEIALPLALYIQRRRQEQEVEYCP